MELFDAVVSRPVIIALAIFGAMAATAGSYLDRRTRVPRRLARTVLYGGYAIAWSSVALFIVAGFRQAYL